MCVCVCIYTQTHTHCCCGLDFPASVPLYDLLLMLLEVSCGLEAETVDPGFESALASYCVGRLLILCAQFSHP